MSISPRPEDRACETVGLDALGDDVLGPLLRQALVQPAVGDRPTSRDPCQTWLSERRRSNPRLGRASRRRRCLLAGAPGSGLAPEDALFIADQLVQLGWVSADVHRLASGAAYLIINLRITQVGRQLPGSYDSVERQATRARIESPSTSRSAPNGSGELNSSVSLHRGVRI